MAQPKGPAAPIDRPLAKAYLREFKGWSTAYSPGLSDPTSLRIMENVSITPEGAARVRPAIRSVFTENVWLNTTYSAQMVGGFEHFFLNDGTKALLFAARLSTGVVAFKVAVYNSATARYDIRNLTDAGVDFAIPQGEATLNFSSATTFVKYLQIDNKIFALSNAGEALRLFNVGADKRAKRITPITVPDWDSGDALTVVHPDAAWINSASKTTIPAAETPTADTLIQGGSSPTNEFSFGYYYTFENEVGESAASQTTIVKASRGWSQWRFFAPDSSGNPTTTSVTDPKMAMDQLVAILPQAVFDAAILQGAVRWNLYMFTWSDQAPVPPEGVLVGTRDLTESPTRETHGWIQNTAAIDVSSVNSPLPTAENRFNYSDPSNAGQGLVAGDRLVLVNDRQDGALIRWSSNQVGEYTNFSPSRGGGFKTLTSGNLHIPVSVKLWQNPQSVDTITILCSGVDGYSTAYYMAPAEVTGQSGSTVIMAFEETTATPGTVSPYGVEVLNNALYHPLDTELMKSTASNYNISHTTMTDDIANKWLWLLDKHKIVSSQYDNKLYYLVHNPEGRPLEEGCNGNEVWVYDTSSESGTWSRWLVQGIALSKLEVGGRLHMAIAKPEAIFVFDDILALDDCSTRPDGRAIPWQLETNTQGVNRAHDAWAHLQQVSLHLGDFQGTFEYGIRGWDVNGKPVEISKIWHQMQDPPLEPNPMPYDIEDFLRVARDLREWFFFARSREDELGEPLGSHGQINLVQYRFTQASVNVGYEFGSVQTNEYYQATLGGTTAYDNGIPYSYIDVRRP